MTDHEVDVPDVAPDYELADSVAADTPAALKALADPTRSQILDLVMERAATVSELAMALDRPKSSVAHHVSVLVDAGLLKVVRTRQVRAITERFYGRTGRTILLGEAAVAGGVKLENFVAEAAEEIRRGGRDVAATMRHARISAADADEFFGRLVELAEEFTKRPRSGDSVYGLIAAVYETDLPTLPDPEADR